jgi:hypothetical protein
MLSRVINASGPLIGPERAQNLLVAMADRLDEFVRSRPDGLGDPQSWIEGRHALRTLLPRLGSRREEALSSMFRGRALDWLTTILRGETFAHGRVEGQRRGKTLLESDELDRVSAAMVERYRHLKLTKWKTLRRPVSALFAWYQAGDPEGVKAMLEAQSKTDSGFLAVLELMSGRVSSSSRGDYRALNASTLCYFMDYDQARKKTEALAKGARSQAMRNRAMALLQQFKDGEAS